MADGLRVKFTDEELEEMRGNLQRGAPSLPDLPVDVAKAGKLPGYIASLKAASVGEEEVPLAVRLSNTPLGKDPITLAGKSGEIVKAPPGESLETAPSGAAARADAAPVGGGGFTSDVDRVMREIGALRSEIASATGARKKSLDRQD